MSPDPEPDNDMPPPPLPQAPGLPDGLPDPVDEPAPIIDRPGALQDLCRELATCDEVALDTEANSMHAYREQTCIIQVTAHGKNAIIDALAFEDLSPLREALDRPDVELLLHGGDYDISCLTRDHDFRFHRVFDTMIAATLLGDEKLGLAALVEAAYGDVLDKRFQRADWARRPLREEQIDYLRRDTLYLPGLRVWLGRRLEEADLVEEAEIEFRRLAGRVGAPVRKDPEGWRRIKGANRLDDVGRCVLHALHQWREGEAERRDVPSFKVFPPRTMLQLAAKPPRRAQQPRTLPFLSHRERSRYGRAILAAVQRGLEAHAAGDIPDRKARPLLDAAMKTAITRNKKTEDLFRGWRKEEAAARRVPNLVVLPNTGLHWMIEHMPATVEDLAACPDLGPKRIDRYGADWIALLDKRR